MGKTPRMQESGWACSHWHPGAERGKLFTEAQPWTPSWGQISTEQHLWCRPPTQHRHMSTGPALSQNRRGDRSIIKLITAQPNSYNMTKQQQSLLVRRVREDFLRNDYKLKLRGGVCQGTHRGTAIQAGGKAERWQLGVLEDLREAASSNPFTSLSLGATRGRGRIW